MSDLTTSTDWLDVAHPSSEDDVSLSFPDPLDKSHFENALENQSNFSQTTDDWLSDVESITSTNHSNQDDFAPTKQESFKTPYASTLVESMQPPESLSSSSRTITDCSGTLTPLKLVVLSQSNDLQQSSEVIKKAFIKGLFDNRPGFVTENNHTSHIVNANNPDCCFSVNEQEWRRTSSYFQLHYEYINIGNITAQDAIFKILLENLPIIVAIPTNEGIEVYTSVLRLRSKLRIVNLDLSTIESDVDENKITLQELTDHTASPKMKRIYESICGTHDSIDATTVKAEEPVSREKVEDVVKVRPKVSAAEVSLKYLVWSFKYTCSVFGLVLVSMLALNTYRLATEGSYDLNWLSRADHPTVVKSAISSPSPAFNAPSCRSKPSLSLTPQPSVKNRVNTIDQAKTTTDISIFNQMLDVVAHIPPMNMVKEQPNTTYVSEKDSFNIEEWINMTRGALNNAYFVSLYYVGNHVRQFAAVAEAILETAYIMAEMGYENAQNMYANLKKSVPSVIQRRTQDIAVHIFQTSQQMSRISREATTHASRNAARLLRGSNQDHKYGSQEWSLNKRIRQTSLQWGRVGHDVENALNGALSHLNKKTYGQLKRAKDNYKRTFSKFV